MTADAVLVDSNVLLDVLTEDARWYSWSAEALARTADEASLGINPIIYGEVSNPPNGYPATIYDPNQPSDNPEYGKITSRQDPRVFRAAVRVSF